MQYHSYESHFDQVLHNTQELIGDVYTDFSEGECWMDDYDPEDEPQDNDWMDDPD